MRTVSILVQLLEHTCIIDILIVRAWHGILDLRCTCRTGLVFCYLAVGSIVFTLFYTLDTLLVRYRGINLTVSDYERRKTEVDAVYVVRTAAQGHANSI